MSLSVLDVTTGEVVTVQLEEDKKETVEVVVGKIKGELVRKRGLGSGEHIELTEIWIGKDTVEHFNKTIDYYLLDGDGWLIKPSISKQGAISRTAGAISRTAGAISRTAGAMPRARLQVPYLGPEEPYLGPQEPYLGPQEPCRGLQVPYLGPQEPMRNLELMDSRYLLLVQTHL